MQTRLFLCVLANFFVLFTTSAQDSFYQIDLVDSVSASCNDCILLEAFFPLLSGTEDYVVNAIEDPALPFPLDQGQVVISTIDDVWSDVISLSFPFCFYGNTYESIVLGSNGVVTFDVTEAGTGCPWAFTAAAPSAALPTNSIFCPYHDINPATCGNVRWQTYGVAPNRQFVVNFDNVCLFSCTSLQTSSQLVLYESTNVIEVYVMDKPACGQWNSGNTLIGIQNNDGSQAVVPPGRNTGNWSASNEAWRFEPAGSQSGDVTWYFEGDSLTTGNTLEFCPDTVSWVYAALNYQSCVAPEGGDNCENYSISVSSGNWPSEVSWDLVNSNGQTVLSGGAPFNQTVCLPNDCYELNMFDSFGDGWNGSNWTIAYEGVNITSATIPGGSIGNASFCLEEFVEDPDAPFVIEAFHLDSVFIDVLFDDLDPGLIELAPLCSYDDPIQLEVEVLDGEWSSDCENCLDDESGVFLPEGLEQGVYTIEYTVEGECGPVTAAIDVEVFDPPSLQLSSPDVLCEFSEVIFLESNFPGGIWSADCASCVDPETGAFDPTGLASGQYQVNYLAGDLCFAEDSVIVQVDPTVTASINEVPELCEESTIQISAESGGGIWSADCGSCINSSTGVFDGTLSGPGNYTVNYTFDELCAISTETNVVVVPSVNASIDLLPILCETGSSEIIQTQQGGGLWQSDCGECLSDQGVFNPTVSGPGSFQVSYSIEGVCSDYDQITVDVVVQRDASIFGVDQLCLDAGTYDIPVAQTGGVWDVSCAGCIDGETGTLDLISAGIGTVTVFYEFPGLCGDNAQKDIEIVPCEVEIPNVFTPNADGVNDELRFKHLEFFPGSSLQILNRWGNTVYESSDYQNNWNADGVSDGTYAFFLTRGDGVKYEGMITITR